MITKLNEAKNLSIYKKILTVFGAYADKFPGTGVEGLLDDLISAGVKTIPKDKKALEILGYIVGENTIPGAVQKLLNFRFSDLPYNVKPVYRRGRKHLVAFWYVGSQGFDKVKSLLSGGGGHWSDVDGDKVTLLDIGEVEGDNCRRE